MLNTLTVPAQVGREISEAMPEAWRFRLQSLTAEESFYALQLVKFKAADPSKAMFYLQLRVRLIRYLKGQERSLFTEREWESLERLWKERFLKFCLREAA